MQDLEPQRTVESDSSGHFVGAQCDRADPLDHVQLQRWPDRWSGRRIGDRDAVEHWCGFNAGRPVFLTCGVEDEHPARNDNQCDYEGNELERPFALVWHMKVVLGVGYHG